MNTISAGRLLLALSLGLAVLTTAGCFGSQNFATSADAAAAPATQLSGNQDTGSADRDVGPRLGNIAPDFTLRALDGGTVTLSDLRGKPVLVNFWATWCPPCKAEMPILQAAYDKYKDEGMVFLGVDMKENDDTVREFVQKYGYNWTFVMDSGGQVANQFQVSGIPTTFFIDHEGIVRERHIGAISASILEAKLDRIR